jgi:hypothetical protein
VPVVFLNLSIERYSQKRYSFAVLKNISIANNRFYPLIVQKPEMKKTFLLPVMAAHVAALRAGAGFFVEPVTGAAFFNAPLLSPIRR